MTTNDALTDFTLKPSQKQKKPNSRQPRSLNHVCSSVTLYLHQSKISQLIDLIILLPSY